MSGASARIVPLGSASSNDAKQGEAVATCRAISLRSAAGRRRHPTNARKSSLLFAMYASPYRLLPVTGGHLSLDCVSVRIPPKRYSDDCADTRFARLGHQPEVRLSSNVIEI